MEAAHMRRSVFVQVTNLKVTAQQLLFKIQNRCRTNKNNKTAPLLLSSQSGTQNPANMQNTTIGHSKMIQRQGP